jgi:hypothetical protein
MNAPERHIALAQALFQELRQAAGQEILSLGESLPSFSHYNSQFFKDFDAIFNQGVDALKMQESIWPDYIQPVLSAVIGTLLLLFTWPVLFIPEGWSNPKAPSETAIAYEKYTDSFFQKPQTLESQAWVESMGACKRELRSAELY